MDNSECMPENGGFFLDKLTLPAVWQLLTSRGLKRVTVLDEIKTSQRLGCWLLKMKGVYVAEAKFFAGHLKTQDGESVYMAARRLSGKIALKAAEKIVKNEPHLHSLNDAYGRNTILLFITKQLRMQILYFTARALVAQSLCNKERALVWLQKPTRFDEELLGEALPGIDLYFYSTYGFGRIELAMSWILDVARDIKLTFGFRRNRRFAEPSMPRKKVVLTLQEDSIHADRSLRGQPHWLDVANPTESFDTYVLEILPSNASITENEAHLSKFGVTILPTSVFRSAMQAMRNDKSLHRVRRDRRIALRAVFHALGFSNRFFLLRVASLLRQAELMGALALWLNVRVFLIRETHYSFSDAMQLVAPDMDVTTIAYQYSNMGFVTPGMMSTADKFLIFSDMYKALYQVDGIMPQELLPTGYLYGGVACLVSEKAAKQRAALCSAGARFIVCYFDESVQYDRWGMVSRDDHLGELHVLCKTILTDPTFGMVVKSQFMRNSPSQLYPEDDLIQAAKSTGRYLELMAGVHRNDIYPTEAALVADLCIGHKFGATAALEAAIAGVRTIMLDPYGAMTLWDDLYAKADIIYESIESLMVSIDSCRNSNSEEQTLGDWKPILHLFDQYRDGKSDCRLRMVLENAMRSSKTLMN